MPLRRSASPNASRRPSRQVHEARVQQRGVLALEEPDAAQIVRERDGDVGALLAQDLRRLVLARRVERREDRGDAGRAQAALADAPRRPAHAGRVEGDDGPAVVLVPALQHDDLAADQRGQVGRPVDEGLEGGAGGQPDPDRGDRRQVAPLDDGVGEVRGPDHHGVDRAPVHARFLEQASQGALDARGHVRGRRGLHGVRDPVVLEQHGIRVGAAHVDADPPHASKTDRKSRS